MTGEIKKTIKPIAVYARVSTSNQEKEGTIETQLSANREYAEKNNYVIVKEYVDNGWSGSILARPGLDKLRQDAKEKIWEAVLIYDPDRLARKGEYQFLIMEELQDLGIDVFFVWKFTFESEHPRIRVIWKISNIFVSLKEEGSSDF